MRSGPRERTHSLAELEQLLATMLAVTDSPRRKRVYIDLLDVLRELKVTREFGAKQWMRKTA